MNYNQIDYTRLLSYDEITDLDENIYQIIINYCQGCHSKYVTKWNNMKVKTKRSNGKCYCYYQRTFTTCGPLYGNTMRDANYFKNSQTPILDSVKGKYRELILANYVVQNNELFIKILNETLPQTMLTNINQLFDQTQKLIYLYHNNYQKFLFMKTAFRIDSNLNSILKTFYEYYQITDPVIILNKITEIFAKYPALIENHKVYNKK